MQKLLEKSTFITAIALGSLVLIPLIILEVVNRARFNEGFPSAVFLFTWVLQVLFIWILLPLIKNIRRWKSLRKNPVILLLQIAGLALIAYIWGEWIIDQWSCLVGIPNCD